MKVLNTLSGHHKEALTTFFRKRDRQEPFAFVGRHEIFDAVEIELGTTRAEGRSLPNPLVIQGPPGSGKTSVLRELAKTYEDSTVIPVPLSGDELHSKQDVAIAFVQALGLPKTLLKTRTESILQGRLGVEWGHLSIGKQTHKRLPIEEIESGESLWSVLADHVKIPKDIVFLALVDEAQRIDPDTHHTHNHIAVTLADGRTHDLKIVTVFGGLSRTTERLKDVGVSRRLSVGSAHQIGSLDPADVKALVGAFLSHKPFGLDQLALNRLALVEQVADASECYPRHLTSYLRGIAQECINDSAHVDLDRALQHGQKHRVEFYEEVVTDSRLSALEDVLVTLAQSKSINENFSKKEIQEIAQATYGMEREDFENAYNKAILSGILTEGMKPPKRADFAIPSMRTFFRVGLDKVKALDALSEQASLLKR